MAIQTKPLSRFTDLDGSQVWMEYDYDDVDLRVRAFRCINQTSKPCYGAVWRANNPNVRYEATFQPNSTFEIGVSTGAAQRIQLTVTPSGKLDGVETEARFPA